MDSCPYLKQRLAMVQTQLVKRGIHDQKVLDAMRQTPRHCFVPREKWPSAYADQPLAIGYDQTISQPYMVALMVQLLNLAPSMRVLEIGTGSGYEAAVLSLLAAQVVTVERIEPLAHAAAQRFRDLGYGNVEVEVGDGSMGMASKSPYDAIVVSAGSPRVPGALKEQLAMGGRLVCPVGTCASQELMVLDKTPRGFDTSCNTPCLFVPLVGAQGWELEKR